MQLISSRKFKIWTSNAACVACSRAAALSTINLARAGFLFTSIKNYYIEIVVKPLIKFITAAFSFYSFVWFPFNNSQIRITIKQTNKKKQIALATRATLTRFTVRLKFYNTFSSMHSNDMWKSRTEERTIRK